MHKTLAEFPVNAQLPYRVVGQKAQHCARKQEKSELMMSVLSNAGLGCQMSGRRSKLRMFCAASKKPIQAGYLLARAYPIPIS